MIQPDGSKQKEFAVVVEESAALSKNEHPGFVSCFELECRL